MAINAQNVVSKNNTKCNAKSNTAYGGIISKEHASNYGSFVVDAYIIAKDTTYVDSLNVELPAILTLSSVNNLQGVTIFSFDTGYVLPGDTLYCSITVSTNAQQLPYYPKQLAFYGKTHNLAGISGSFKITGVVYFTLYNTLEIWSINDFHRQPRVWTMEKSPEPDRTYISKENIPVSNLFPEALITAEWQRNYWLKSVTGLPYKIKMRPLHPDTIAAMKLKDSIESGTRGLGKGGFTWYQRNMYGSVTGTIRAGYTNDLNSTQTFNLKGITVAAYDEDNLWNDFLGSAITDENGNFTINYDTYQWEEHIELFVRILTSNSGTGVYQDDNNPCLLNDVYVLSTSNVNVTEGHHVTDIGAWNLPTPAREPFKILNWATRAQEFVNTQVGSVPRDYLRIFCYGAGSDFINFPCQRLRLEDEDVSHETVIWHEMGHYLMDNLSGAHISANGNHMFEHESIFTLAWNEGWATGFMNMVDQYYRNLDAEYGWYAFTESGQQNIGGTIFINRINTEARSRLRLESGTARNGMKSEYHIGTFLYDLYDGPSKFANTEPSLSYDDSPNSTHTTNLIRTGFDSPLTDDLELTPAQIFAPLIFAKQYSFGVYSINQYYRLLVRQLNDCGQPQKVQKLLTQNGILDWTPNQANNTNILSTDLIGNKLTMTGYFGPFGSLSVTDNYYNDINELNGISQNFNLGLATATTDYQGITDILEVKNGAKLGINADMNIGFSSGPASATNSTLYVHVCNQNLTINSTSSLVIGGTQRIGIVTIKGGTNLILKTGSTLEIKANSSLVLEAGAKLIFEKGAIIKLNSTTSIIIVKHGSKIQIGKDAEFNYSGDGFIRFETNNLVTIPAIEAIGQNAQFKLIGGSFGSTSKKLMEITGSGTLADLTTFNSPAALYNLRTFSIQNGNIVLDADSRIVIGGTTTIAYFRSLVIKAAIPNTSNGKHRGIVVNGQSGNSFYKVNITDAKTGITSNNFYGGSDITMLEITATRCERAIFIWGAGANLNNVRIDNCGTAIDLLGMSRSTRLYKIELYYNSTGINALNCVNNIIELYDPRIWSNYYGLYGDNSQFTAKCGIIKNCSSSTLNSSSKYNGANVFLTNNANLTLDPVMRPGAGKIDMSNLRSVSVRQSLASYGPYINQSASSLYTNIDYSIVGTLSKRSTTLPVYPSLPSDNNLWGYTSGVSRSAISLVDYNTEYQYGSLGSRNVDYIDFFPISAFTSCYPNTTGGGGDEERMRGFINGIVTPIKDLPNRQLADGSMIKEKIQEGYNYFFDMSPNYQQSVNNLIYALNAEFTTTELLDWNIAIPIINSQLIEALSEGLNEGNISKYNADSTGYSETVQNTVNLQDKLLANFSNDAELTFSITLAKASLLRMLGNRALSIQVLNAPIPNLSTEMNNIKSSYICMTTKEKMLLDGTFTPTDIDTINNCVSQDFSSLIPYYDETENGNEFTKKDNNSNSTSFISFPIKIYPNPSYGTFNVKFKGIEATEYSIEIVDIIGKKVYNSQGIILLDNNIQLDLSYLNAGTYFMKMVNGKDVQTKQLVIVK